MKSLRGIGFTNYTINHYLLGAAVEKWLVKNPVSLSKYIVSASNFFMHFFNMSVIYLQTVQKIQWKL